MTLINTRNPAIESAFNSPGCDVTLLLTGIALLTLGAFQLRPELQRPEYPGGPRWQQLPSSQGQLFAQQLEAFGRQLLASEPLMDQG